MESKLKRKVPKGNRRCKSTLRTGVACDVELQGKQIQKLWEGLGMAPWGLFCRFYLLMMSNAMLHKENTLNLHKRKTF